MRSFIPYSNLLSTNFVAINIKRLYGVCHIQLLTQTFRCFIHTSVTLLYYKIWLIDYCIRNCTICLYSVTNISWTYKRNIRTNMPYKIMFHNITYHSVKTFYSIMSPLASTAQNEDTFQRPGNVSLWFMGDGEGTTSTVALQWLEPNQDWRQAFSNT